MPNATETTTTMAPEQARTVRDHAMPSMALMRWLTTRLIENLTPAQWMHQVSPGSNHVMFNVGHIAMVDANFLTAAGKTSRAVPQSYEVLFNAGCQPSDKAADYPDPAEVIDVLQRVREELVAHLNGLSGERLLGPTADPRLTDICPTIAHLPAFIASHEATHSGQIMLIRRALGLPGVLGM